MNAKKIVGGVALAAGVIVLLSKVGARRSQPAAELHQDGSEGANKHEATVTDVNLPRN